MAKTMKYGCHNLNKSRLIVPYSVQVGWTADGRRKEVTHHPAWRDMPCGHTERGADPKCEGCKWRNS